jgi:2-phospho-L-lactate guanylyltransferase
LTRRPRGNGPYVIVPVKGLGEAKSRLSKVLDSDARAELVLAMLDDVLSAVRAIHDGPLLVVTPDVSYESMASNVAAEVIIDSGEGYNAAVKLALGIATAHEIQSALILPADQARVQPKELEIAIEALKQVEVVVVPSHDGGTGLLGLRPPEVIAPSFGLQSALRHRMLGEAAGLEVTWLELPSLHDDVDTVDDLLRESTPLGVATATFATTYRSILKGTS